THDRDWLKAHGWPVLREVARFWTSRATYDAARHRYDIAHVTSVAESHNDIPNDTFTNISASTALRIAVAAAGVVGEQPDPQWERIAKGLYIPLSPDGQHHLAFDPRESNQGEGFPGGPLVLLFMPSLDLALTPQLRRGDYDYATRGTSLRREGTAPMGIAPRAIPAD